MLHASPAMYHRCASLCGVTSTPCVSSILSHLRVLKALKVVVLFACMPSHYSSSVCGLSFQVQGVFNNENLYLLSPPTHPIFPLLLCPTDIKRLAEKEDWVVDNEGLTSLVGILVSCRHFLCWFFSFFFFPRV